MKNLRLVPEAQLIKPTRKVYMSNIISKKFIFNNTNIRSEMHEGQLYWSIVDIIESIYGSGEGSSNWSKVKKNGLNQCRPFWTKLKLPGSDGKMYLTDCATEIL